MIGLSVSLCILDIVDGTVPLDQVEKIVAGTKCPDAETWNSLILRYRESHWREKADECERVLRQLLAAGKIEQPRLTEGHSMRPANTRRPGQVHWVAKESEIEFD